MQRNVTDAILVIEHAQISNTGMLRKSVEKMFWVECVDVDTLIQRTNTMQ